MYPIINQFLKRNPGSQLEMTYTPGVDGAVSETFLARISDGEGAVFMLGSYPLAALSSVCFENCLVKLEFDIKTFDRSQS